MNGWIESFNFSIGGAALILCVIGLWFTATLPGMNRWSKRFFVYYFIVLMALSFSGFIELILNHYPVPGTVIYIVMFMESVFISLPLPMLTAYMLHICGESIRSGRLVHTALGLLAIYFFLLVIAPFIGVVSYISQGNQYCRGPLYPLLLLPLIALLLLNLSGALRRRAQMSHKASISFIIAQLPMIAALIVMLFVDATPFFDISYALSALAMYRFILSDQIEQDRRQQQELTEKQREIAEQQREIANQRTSVMVLQMRPHFIYNTLMSIYSLCMFDPQKARQITMDFTNYLRKNFNAISSDSTIPFSTELEHTRAYLAVEQAQFGNMLIVEYDTQFTHFRLPPLTLQPIVENAVKHGMDLDSGPLRISIRTRNTDTSTEIIVEDNGPGFDPSDENRPHTALDNIRQRLEMMCDGKLDVMSRNEGGTTVIVTIRGQKEER